MIDRDTGQCVAALLSRPLLAAVATFKGPFVEENGEAVPLCGQAVSCNSSYYSSNRI